MRVTLIALVGLMCGASLAGGQSSEYFAIRVIDDQTGRGVPLVELKTTNDTTYYTDSNGIVAFYEPGLMDQPVYFSIRSDGYQFPEDFLGNRGVALHVTKGGSAVLKIRRTIIAERLYRITGEGIYRDSVLVGFPVPIKNPVLNGQVMGQDGALAIPYRGKLHWFFGDTAKPSYPLGNFGTSGATSEWPSAGGLDPNVGIDLSYFVDESGFSRPMLPAANFPGPGPKWIGGLKIVADEAGSARLIADYARIKDLGEAYERGLAILNDKTESFERLAQFDGHEPILSSCWGGHPISINVSGIEYYYQNYVPPFLCRMRADLIHVQDPASYEGFSPLIAGARYEKAASKLDRAPDGSLLYAWKKNTPPLSPSEEQELMAAGKMKASDALFQLRSLDTDHAVKPGPGTIQWNSFRRRWVMIVKEDEGLANHGTIWFAEADTPLGPWVYATQILRHDFYNFYNPLQHAFFDQDNGRVIFLEGTYSDFFAAGGPLTPRYNYNQIMYRLDLSDPRLALPVPVYRVRQDRSPERYLLKDELDARKEWSGVDAIAFFAIPPFHSHDGLIPIFASTGLRGTVLRSQPSSQASGAKPLFYALPISPPAATNPQGLAGKWSCKAEQGGESDYASLTLDLRLDGEVVRAVSDAGDVQGTFRNGDLRLVLKTGDGSYTVNGELTKDKISGTWQSRTETAEHGALHCDRSPVVRPPQSPAIVPLYEYANVDDGSYLYSTDPDLPDKQLKRSAQPLCRVWRNPLTRLFLDPDAQPVPLRAQELPQSSGKAPN